MSRTIEINEKDLDSRAQALAEAFGQAVEEAAERANAAWRETQPARHEAAKAIEEQGRQLGKMSRRLWRKEIRPRLQRFWNRRTVAIGAAGAAGAAVPAMLEDAAVELGLRPRRSHWGAFVAGIIIGGLTGVLVAMLTASKPGVETREELAARARDAAEAAGEWIPVGISGANGNGGTGATPEATEVETEG
ncbi:MAG TPA: YtxH domain-containing protein [Candidatus Limnocylindria bacterium]|jgi:urease accessory protein UreF|nr:YtxH domain-containing protein [Candidatus Limnocylindria bacterium]